LLFILLIRKNQAYNALKLLKVNKWGAKLQISNGFSLLFVNIYKNLLIKVLERHLFLISICLNLSLFIPILENLKLSQLVLKLRTIEVPKV